MPGDFGGRASPPVPRALSRAAAFAFASSLALSGCAATTTGTDGAVGPDVGVDTPTSDTSTSDTSTSDAAADAPRDVARDVADDDGATAALYGDPPPRDAGPPDDNGGPGVEYGGPFHFDAGPMDDAGSQRDAAVDDGGGGFFLYGAPPPPEPP